MGQVFQVHASGNGDEPGCMNEMGGFIHAAPEGFRTEVGGIRFQHDTVFRAPACGFRHCGGVFKSSHSGEGDHAVQFVKDSRGLSGISDEAMKDGTHAARVVPGNRQGVLKACGAFPVPRMQDDIEAQARRQVKMLFQHILLKAAEIFLLPARGGNMEIVQPRFPNGGQGNVLRYLEKTVRPAFRRFMGIIRMDAQRAEDYARELARPCYIHLPIIWPCPQRNHAVSVCLEGMLNVGFPAGLVELGGGQMAMRVNDHGIETPEGQGKFVDICRL